MNNSSKSRRTFLKNSGVVGLGFLGLQSYISTAFSGCKNGLPPAGKPKAFQKYGTIISDPKGILNLPMEFSYKIIARSGTMMSDGFYHPDKPDGMATFQGSDGKVIIVRNHELLTEGIGAFGLDNGLKNKISKSDFFDYAKGNTVCKGGTTTLVFNENTQEVEKSYLSLAGTLRNCAGGGTPWNSWISCEEVMVNAGSGDFVRNHGYNFEVPAGENIQLASPAPLKAMGRFNHEAVCVDPRTGIVYQTEDRGDGLIYRFIPNVKGQLQQGGKLQALTIKKEPKMDTRNWDRARFPKRKKMMVQWIDLEDVDSPGDDLRYRGFNLGAARFARGEGMWFGYNECYFACTNGGKSKTGQVFRYHPSPFEGTADEQDKPGTLELFLEPNDTKLLSFCDNLTIAPWGDIILCEDRDRPNIVGVTPDGKYYRFGENVGFRSEFAGGVFSPSGKTFFVNIQHAGLTIAIQGPWLMHG